MVSEKATPRSFAKLKSALTSDCVMAHYDAMKETQLRVDPSPVGLGAILIQRDGTSLRPVALGSRTLTDVERRYLQTEREALAVIWGCERFHIYLYGKELFCESRGKSSPFPLGKAILFWLKRVPCCLKLPSSARLQLKLSSRIFREYSLHMATQSRLLLTMVHSSCRFLEAHGSLRRKVTPYWPQAVAEVERFNQPLEKVICEAFIEGKNLQVLL